MDNKKLELIDIYDIVILRHELDRTKKALDVAVDALKEIIDWDTCVALQSNDFVGIANKALEQIKALEQKYAE